MVLGVVGDVRVEGLGGLGDVFRFTGLASCIVFVRRVRLRCFCFFMLLRVGSLGFVWVGRIRGRIKVYVG